MEHFRNSQYLSITTVSLVVSAFISSSTPFRFYYFTYFQASKTAKRVFTEAQNQPYKDQQLQTLPYNPYVYWPYYGRA